MWAWRAGPIALGHRRRRLHPTFPVQPGRRGGVERPVGVQQQTDGLEARRGHLLKRVELRKRKETCQITTRQSISVFITFRVNIGRAELNPIFCGHDIESSKEGGSHGLRRRLRGDISHRRRIVAPQHEAPPRELGPPRLDCKVETQELEVANGDATRGECSLHFCRPHAPHPLTFETAPPTRTGGVRINSM